MKTTVMILAVASCVFGCSGQPVKTGQPEVATDAPRPAPMLAPKGVTQPVHTPRIAADPLNDPNSPLAKRSVYYDFDKSDIKDEYKPVIQAHSGYLSEHPGTKVRVEGNCDERGSREYNLALGQRCAESIKTTLKLLGAGDGQIDSVSCGEEKPKAAGHDEAA